MLGDRHVTCKLSDNIEINKDTNQKIWVREREIIGSLTWQAKSSCVYNRVIEVIQAKKSTNRFIFNHI